MDKELDKFIDSLMLDYKFVNIEEITKDILNKIKKLIEDKFGDRFIIKTRIYFHNNNNKYSVSICYENKKNGISVDTFFYEEK